VTSADHFAEGSGYVFAFGPCWACRRVFGFHPERVCSIVVDGEREPLCLACVEHANDLRRENGNPLMHVLPGAYADDMRREATR
jgi:hypothetical protein